MRILVIDDMQQNIGSAYETLKGNDLTTCQNMKSAYEILKGQEEFDAVLTDLFMPLGSFRGSMNLQDNDYPHGDLPAGLIFAIKAANKGIRTIICTDRNHHNDWLCAILDLVDVVWKGKDPEHSSGDAKQIVACVRADYVQIKGYWDHKKQEIVNCDWDRIRNMPILKNWLQAMQMSGLFPELKA